MKLWFRELQKAILQYVFLPLVYCIYRHKEINQNLVVLADSKSDSVPFSLNAMYEELQKRNYEIVICCIDYSKLNLIQKIVKSVSFMKVYAQAKYVFICDYFLPVSSCKKKKETKVIQLWHSSGLQKKFGFDCYEDLGNLKIVNPVRNFDVVSVSSNVVRDVFMEAWQLDKNSVQALGSSRTDILMDEEYSKKCNKEFYHMYPEAKGKKIVLWAPSFRGDVEHRSLQGIDTIQQVQEEIGDSYFIIIKLHPHLSEKKDYDNCVLSANELLPVVDILITDYSSIFYDFLLFEKEVVFFCPDYEHYSNTRGLYIEYKDEFYFPVVKDGEGLLRAIKTSKINLKAIKKYKNKFVEKNDGDATKRILEYVENNL